MDRTSPYLVTAAPEELAEPIAQALDMDGALGTIAETDAAGRYTGRLIGDIPQGAAKAQAVTELADRESIDLRRSHAYSDTIHDQDMLRAVGYPHAVNADPKLLEIAVRNGWAVHEMRPVRRQLLVGVPAFVPIGVLVAAGYAARARKK